MLAYLSHSLVAGNGDQMVLRHDNISNAIEWWKWLVIHTHLNVQMPWLPAVAGSIHELFRPKVYENQLEAIRRSDMLVIVGELVSPHQNEELDVAAAAGVAVLDLTDFGREPPPMTASLLMLLHARIAAAAAARPASPGVTPTVTRW